MLLFDHGRASKVTAGILNSPFEECCIGPFNKLFVPQCTNPPTIIPCIGERSQQEQHGPMDEPAQANGEEHLA